MNRNKLAILLLLVLACIIRVLIIFNFDNKPGDTMSHVESALRILESPGLFRNFDANTSVLYNYMLAASIYFWNNPLLSPRIFTVIFGIAVIIPFYLLIKILFNERIAFYSGLLLVFYPLHAFQSGYTTSDIVFQFFLISALYCFFKFRQNKQRLGVLILSVVLLNIAALLRFESWIFIPLLPLFLCGKKIKYPLIFFFSAAILPCVWLFFCYYITKDTFYSFTMPAKTMRAQILSQPAYSKEVLGWLRILSSNIGFHIVLIGLCGIAAAFLRRKSFYLALFFLLLLSAYTVNSLLSRMWYAERYTLILGLLILPYSFLFIEKVTLLLKINPIIVFLPFILFSLLNFNKIYHLPIFYMPTMVTAKFPREISDIAMWLKENNTPGDKIILGSSKLSDFIPDIVVRSGISPRRFFEVYTPLVEEIHRPKSRILEYIFKERPRYIVLHSNSYLREALDFDMEQEELDNFDLAFKRVFVRNTTIDSGNYSIYEISYNNKNGI